MGIIILLFDMNYGFFPSPLNKLRKIYPEIDLTLDIFNHDGKEISDFALENTDPNSIFIVPPDFGSFRIAAKRAIVVDLKCIEASDNGIAKWWERINDCYGKLVTNGSVKEKRNQIYENYKLIDDDRLKYVSEK